MPTPLKHQTREEFIALCMMDQDVRKAHPGERDRWASCVAAWEDADEDEDDADPDTE